METKLQEIADFFNIGKVESFKRLGGAANQNYLLITVEGEFVCKIVKEHPLGDLQKELVYLARLNESSIPVVLPLENKAGQRIFVSDDIVAVVMQKVEGLQPEISTETNRELGIFLARLHGTPFEGLPQKGNWLSDTYLPDTLARTKDSFPVEVGRLYKEYVKLQLFRPGNFSKSIIHGDLFEENVLFKNSTLSVALDWEEVGIGCSLLDFARSAMALAVPNNTFDKNLYLAFAEGYESVRPIGASRKIIVEAIKYAALTRAAWILLRFGLQEPNPDEFSDYDFYWREGFDILDL